MYVAELHEILIWGFECTIQRKYLLEAFKKSAEQGLATYSQGRFVHSFN